MVVWWRELFWWDVGLLFLDHVSDCGMFLLVSFCVFVVVCCCCLWEGSICAWGLLCCVVGFVFGWRRCGVLFFVCLFVCLWFAFCLVLRGVVCGVCVVSLVLLLVVWLWSLVRLFWGWVVVGFGLACCVVFLLFQGVLGVVCVDLVWLLMCACCLGLVRCDFGVLRLGFFVLCLLWFCFFCGR